MGNEIIKYDPELNTIPLRKFTPVERQITSLIRTSPESFNGSLLMMYF
ncbi:hypothetical protein ACS4N0_10365 [Levilactobacillus zymae]